MSSAIQSYIATLLVYLAVNGIACWALNLQFGIGGVMNFAFIIYQAAGAYFTAVFTLPSDTASPEETYILGLHWPWPLPLLGAAVAGAVLALAVGSFALRPPRRDFQATVMLVVSSMVVTLVTAEQGWFNGGQGLYGIPQPFASSLNLSITGYEWVYLGITAAAVLLVLAIVVRLTSAPWGRRLRAMRDNADAAESLGIRVRKERLVAYVIGGALAAVSGGLLVDFIGAWSPAAWGTGETFIFFVAIIVGGLGSNFGAFFGAFLVLGVFLELPTYLPQFASANTEESLQSAAIGVLVLVFLWFRPQGIFPERRRKLSRLIPAAIDTERLRAPVPPSPALPAVAPVRLAVRDLQRDFGGVHAVDGLSFEIEPGKLTGLIGPNGAGKSTALKLISGADRPNSGHVLMDGRNTAGWPAWKVARLGVVRTFQHTSEFGKLTVLENLLTAAPGQPGSTAPGALLMRPGGRRRQLELLTQAHALLADFGLTAHADTYAGQLSGGQRRLVEIMRALMASPRVLLLDEPMAGVNPTLRLVIEEHLKRLRDGGLTMLMVEHELGSVERVCDSVIVMAQGKLLATGTMAELRGNEEVVSAYLAG
jgi:ABC-type branched-subunit amino acid transport system ATPase component/ABC-type branched-subunit amino acid transport system permease subunit